MMKNVSPAVCQPGKNGHRATGLCKGQIPCRSLVTMFTLDSPHMSCAGRMCVAGGARCVLGWYRPSAGIPGALCVRKKFQSVRHNF